mgnify:CR=1 FL=1
MLNPTPDKTPDDRDEISSQDADNAVVASHGDGDADLSESIKQEQYRREYLRQIRLRSCPGCGDDEIV